MTNTIPMPQTLASLLREQRHTLSVKTAIASGEDRKSYEDLAKEAEELAGRFTHEGLAAGTRIAVLARNSEWFYRLLGAVAMARLCLVPLNHRLAATELSWIIGDAAPSILFVGGDLEHLAQAAVAGCESKPRIVVIRSDGRIDAWAEPRTGRIDQLVEPTAADDLLQLYTSGTTGRPKGVVLSNGNIAAIWAQSSGVPGFDYKLDDVVLTVMPQFHIAGINSGLLSLFAGATMVVASEFSPEGVLSLIETHHCTRAFFVPSMIIMLLDYEGLDERRCASLKEIAYGGSAIHGALLYRARTSLACDFAQLYGMTETTGAGTTLSPKDHDQEDKAGSCGRAWPGLEIDVVDHDHRLLPVGQRGQLVIRGATIMQGYWGNPKATKEAFCDFGLLTGDGGYIDQDGFVFIQDRIKDMIITGGENVAPTEVEDAIAGCPGVRDVAVIGVASERWGEEVRACVVLDDTEPATAADIVQWARDRIASYKLPKRIDFVDAIPRNASGKILRRELREKACS